VFAVNSHDMDIGVHSPGVKRQEHEPDHSSPAAAEARPGGAKPPFPLMSSWHSASLIMHRNNFLSNLSSYKSAIRGQFHVYSLFVIRGII
jgi:hypothetical protein